MGARNRHRWRGRPPHSDPDDIGGDGSWLLPLAIGAGEPGREIEGPMAIVILGGLMTSMALNLLVLPTLALRFARFDTKAPGKRQARDDATAGRWPGSWSSAANLLPARSWFGSGIENRSG